MTRSYEPELGQWIFGNPTGAYDFDSLDGSQAMEDMLRVIVERATGDGYYADYFENDVFELRPYYWGDCTCGYDEKEYAWDKANDHRPECYQADYERLYARYGVGSKIPDEEIKAICEKHGVPYNDRKGCAVHCTCDYKDRWQAFLRENPGHADDCAVVLPNFRHKASGLEIRWYKYIGRGMSINRSVTLDEFRTIFDECVASLKGGDRQD